MKTVLATILKYHNGDCSNHGISSREDYVHCFWDCTNQEAEQYCKEHNIKPEDCVIYEDRHLWGEHKPIFVPLIYPEHKVGPMFGGSWVEEKGLPHYEGMKFSLPIPLHDRFETQEEYDILSR